MIADGMGRLTDSFTPCEYLKTHGIVHFKWLNWMVGNYIPAKLL